MSIVVQEIAGSKVIDWQPGSTRTGERVFIVYDDEDVPINHDDILEAADLPGFGEAHPDASGLWASGYSMRMLEDRANTWEITWSYTVIKFSGEGTDDDEAFTPGLNISIGQNVIDMWRSNPNKPPNVSSPGLTTDIGGSIVHVAGHPISMALPKADITIKSQIITNNFNGYGLLQHITRRNSEAWLGFPAGSVLFHGVNISKNGNVYDLDWSLTWDFWYHLRQVPNRSDIDGEIIDPGSCFVWFRQPFPLTTSFAFLPQVS